MYSAYGDFFLQTQYLIQVKTLVELKMLQSLVQLTYDMCVYTSYLNSAKQAPNPEPNILVKDACFYY